MKTWQDMTDRELLELAAKAAGVAGEWVDNYNGDYYYQGNTDGILYELPHGGWFVWNPLTAIKTTSNSLAPPH